MREYQRLETGEAEPPPPESVTVRPMSPLHRMAFAASIMFVAAVVASFLWALPCDVATCPARPAPPDIPWDRTITGLELVGSVHAVGGRVLVAGGEGASWGRTNFQGHGALVGLAAALGELLWYIELPSAPRFLSCPPEQPPVCFTLIPPATLGAINPISGIFMWQNHYKNWSRLEHPILIPDVDKDDSADIALIATSENGAEIVVISGRRGNVTSSSKINQPCESPSNLIFDQISTSFNYTCSSPKDASWEMIPGNGIVKGGSSYPGQGGPEGYTIEYSNSETCPDCSVHIEVKDPNGKKLWSYNDLRVYVMRPLPLHFKIPNQQDSISGFLLKLWHWQAPPKQVWDGVKVESIRERIVLITLNARGANFVNASQTEIIRLCNSSDYCQPSIHSDTALIADVNGDGKQDLVSYFVTYQWVPDENTNNTRGKRWQLESRIRVIRLEAELPKLFHP